jgi:hypothetical protein
MGGPGSFANGIGRDDGSGLAFSSNSKKIMHIDNCKIRSFALLNFI